ncbi:9-O-acetylesterase [Dysgonomonas sp. GY75]|uniref:sialate O-acetylesterase n=1 Tax=Dysgonomonas sp. GY75 TaxID=2780419 RepID=UPI001883ECDD|nr:sialate O-acetylesterase [Dysgonomonas sp. GY75]MBF0650390.1 9-O-acetylesterase [Dysgonomonas sp. GY75]
MKKNLTFLICFFSITFSVLHAEVKLPRIFSDNMVLQRDKPIKVWGWADKNETVEVSFLDQQKKVKADKNGNWTILLTPVSHGGPYTMQVKGKNNSITFQNILIGEVWLCSGQSNMEWQVKSSMNAKSEISNADFPEIRSFNVVKDLDMKPKSDLKGSWEVCSPATVGDFSAVAYFFARKLYQELNVPIGIINSSWGGTDIETWTSPESFSKLGDIFKERYKALNITDFDKFAKESEEGKKAFTQAMLNDPGVAESWFNPTLNTSTWKKMQVPKLWDGELGSVDGILWFRYALTLPESVEGKSGTIRLGPIDDNDVTWINGIKVGETNGYNINRSYAVPANVLKAGQNIITVKIVDNAGGGGLYGKPEDLTLDAGGKSYPLAGEWLYKVAVSNKAFNYVEFSPNMYSSLLYNAMINPIIQYPIKGAIWYQGENNAGQAYNYRTLFPNMITDWRTKWGYEFPFYWVQLANFMAKDDVPQDSDWAELREAQSMTLSLPKTGEAVITDIGEANDIHPRNKQDVGLRLALNALNKDYGKTDIIYSGPTFKSMEVDGDKAIISFNNIGKGLKSTSKYGYIEGFAIAGTDNKFVWAKAYIEGDKVIVYSDNISKPVSVRYSWSNNPDVNLFNSEGLPAAPFRTDCLKGITQRD